MRDLVMTLIELFGQQHNRDIQVYLGQQWIKESEYKGVQFRLSEVNGASITRDVRNICADLGLGADVFLQHTMMRPYVNQRGNFAPLIELKDSYYQQRLDSIATTEAFLVYKGDTVQYSGKHNHIVLKRKRGKRKGDSIAAGLNGTTKDGVKFSLFIDKTQWLQMLTDYHDVKFNSTQFVDVEWQDSAYRCFLYQRLIDEFIGAELESLAPQDYRDYRNAVAFQQHFYNNSVVGSGDVYSSRGYKIGTSVKLFDSADVLAAKQAEKAIVKSKVNLHVIVDNDKSTPQSSRVAGAVGLTDIPDQESFEEWGTF